MRTKNFPEKQNRRRKGAVIRLGKQIDKGTKMTKEGEQPLTASDVQRIKKEMYTLNNRLVSSAKDKRTKKHR